MTKNPFFHVIVILHTFKFNGLAKKSQYPFLKKVKNIHKFANMPVWGTKLEDIFLLKNPVISFL